MTPTSTNGTRKAFEKEQKKLLADPEIREAWLEYQSRFPYVSLYFRNAPQYRNQIAVVNGRKVGTDINLFKLFTEQCVNLLCDGGRCGIIVPTGIYTDLGTTQLRELLFSACELDALFGLSNEKYIFDGVHHAFKFCLLTFEKGGSTDTFRAAFRINPREAIRPSELESFLANRATQVALSVPLIRRLSPDSISVVEFKTEHDVRIAEKMTAFPTLGEPVEAKWNLVLTSGFHITNDSYLFRTESGKGLYPLYEGKMTHQFEHRFGEPRYWVDEKESRKALLKKGETDQGQKLDYQDYRMVFRRIASSTNERTMIATILPSNSFASESLSLSSGKSLTYGELLALVSILNSFVLDSCLRQRVSANINMFYVYQLPVPRLTEADAEFTPIVTRAAKLSCTTPEFEELAQEVGLGSSANGVTDPIERTRLRAELDAMIAHLYGLTAEEFTHILSTFPLVAQSVKDATLDAYGVFAPAPDDPQ
jgi:hypothetical protein